MKHFSYTILAFLLISCAQTSPLTGGPRDEHAPTIDSAKTYPHNGQINFAEDRVRIKFNEYIKLNNPSDNILIIPSMKESPTIEAKNKKLTIEFNEELQENTTYSITFNNAIQDITESNDSVFQFVFSTGEYIDSLEITGEVKDAFTNKGQKEILVALYPKNVEANFDSIPLKIKPTYLSQTDANGNFRLNYLKDGAYFIFAFKDKNKNLLYDMGEAIAFTEEKEFNLKPTDTNKFTLRSFTEKSDEIELEDLNFDYPGRVEVILSNPTDDFRITSNLPLIKEETERPDSIIYWLEQKPVPKMRFYTTLLGELDTLKPIYKGIPEKEDEIVLTQSHNIMKGELLPEENLEFVFSEPVAEIDFSSVHFYDLDSNEVAIEEGDVDVRKVTFQTFGTLAERIVIDSAAVQSLYGHENREKIELTFKNHEIDYYGSLIVSMDTTFNVPIVVHLINDKGDVVDTTKFKSKMVFSELIPGNYQLRLIFDVDNSGTWTSGSLAEGRVPEKVIYNAESIKVKSKWEKEVDWILNSE